MSKLWSNSEFALQRDPPPVPYEHGGEILMVPMRAVSLTFQMFADYAKRRLEAGCFWYGTRRESGDAQVAAVVVPQQENHWGNYHVSTDAMADVSAATRPYGWKNLAQLHTHPGAAVEHSRYDDVHANSRRSLSFVLPFYGVHADAWLSDVGVHEFQSEYWHLLTRKDACRRVGAAPSSVDVQLLDLR